MAKYTYELDTVLSIEADSDEEAFAKFHEEAKRLRDGVLLLSAFYGRTDNSGDEDSVLNTWPPEKLEHARG